ncbi:MAG: helix-turn-helix transcriptional regulator [Clostridia bacterium]|nr:helix-turn-helix transcriptional regulator [Clostridia bacterium]
MALTQSVDQVDENGRELLTYGTPDFPIAFFDDDLTKVAVPPHWHDEFEFVLVTEGRVSVRIAGREFPLGAGDGYFANSGILHAAELLSRTGHQHAMVFSPRLISGSPDLVWNTCVAPILENPGIPFIRLSATVPWQGEILTMAETAWQYGAYEKTDYPIHVRYFLSQSFARILRQSESIQSESACIPRYQRDELRIKKVLLFIEQNYGNVLSLEDIAASASISISTCLRLFSSVLGTTPNRYLMDYRLRKAAEFLHHPGGRSITEIAQACGFSDASYFNRCFRKMYGTTPTRYTQAPLG